MPIFFSWCIEAGLLVAEDTESIRSIFHFAIDASAFEARPWPGQSATSQWHEQAARLRGDPLQRPPCLCLADRGNGLTQNHVRKPLRQVKLCPGSL